MAVNDNSTDIRSFRGAIRVCPFCSNATLPLPLHTTCKFCLSSGYVAHCLKCDGKGKVGQGTVWDNGRSVQEATCGACGGLGVIPARQREFEAQETAKLEKEAAIKAENERAIAAIPPNVSVQPEPRTHS